MELKLIDVLPYYIGCSVKVINKMCKLTLHSIHPIIDQTLCGINTFEETDEVIIQGWSELEKDWVQVKYPFQFIKLRLKPLDQLRDEDVEFLYSQLGWNAGSTTKREFILIGLRNNQLLAADDSSEVFEFKDFNFIANYLRKKGYDLDNLIPRNLAIEYHEVIVKYYPITTFL